MSLDELSQFYRNFAELDHAGISYLKSFETLSSAERDLERKQKLQIMIHFLKKGRPLAEGLKATKFVPVFDIPLIRAAENSGRLVDTFKKLSLKYLDTSIAAKSIRSQLTKPFFTFCSALFILPFPDLFTERISLSTYLINSLVPLLAVLLIAFSIYRIWFLSFYNFEYARHWQRIFAYVPYFQSLGHRIAIENFASALSLMLESGIDLFESLREAGLCSAKPQVIDAINRVAAKVQNGNDLSEAFIVEKVIPHPLTSAIQLGHQSGKLPEFLQRYSKSLKADIDQSIQAFTKVFPTVIYILVVLYVSYSIVMFYKGQLSGLQKIAE